MNAIHQISSSFDIVGGAVRSTPDTTPTGMFGEVLDTVAAQEDDAAAAAAEETNRDDDEPVDDDERDSSSAEERERHRRAPGSRADAADATALHVPFGHDAAVRGAGPITGRTAANDAGVTNPDAVDATALHGPFGHDAAARGTRPIAGRAGANGAGATNPDAGMDFRFEAPAEMAAPGARLKLDAQLAQQRPGVLAKPLTATVDGALMGEADALNALRAGAQSAAERKFAAGEAALDRIATRKSAAQDAASQSAPTDANAPRRTTFAERMADLADRLAQRHGNADTAQQIRPQPVALPLTANAPAAAQPNERAGVLPFALTSADAVADAGQAAAQAAQRTIHAGHAATQVATRIPQAPSGTPAEQVSVQIQHGLRNEGDRINVRLYPAALGKVEVKLELSPDKTVQAIVTAERPETLDLLARDARVLQRALEHAGLQTDANSLSFRHDDGGNGDAHRFAGRNGSGPANGSGARPNDDAGAILHADTAGQPRRAAHDGVLDVEI